MFDFDNLAYVKLEDGRTGWTHAYWELEVAVIVMIEDHFGGANMVEVNCSGLEPLPAKKGPLGIPHFGFYYNPSGDRVGKYQWIAGELVVSNKVF